MLPQNTLISGPVDDLNILEIVKNFDFNQELTVMSYTGKKIVESLVTSTRRSDTRDLLLIETDYHEVKLILTPDHKVYDVNTKKFIRATEIKTGVSLKHIDDIDINVVKVRKIKNNALEDVYTLTVDETQCFFASGVLVHNDL